MEGCYLIHFDQKHHHAQHYIGCSQHIGWRIRRHLDNNGARLLKTLNGLGISWQVVRVWPVCGVDERYKLEQQLKSRKKSATFCPICNPNVQVDWDEVKEAATWKA